MKRGFLDYVKDNPYTEQELFTVAAETEEERLSRRIKEAIRRGEPLQDVLKECISFIGSLIHNQAWADDLTAELEKKDETISELDIPL